MRFQLSIVTGSIMILLAPALAAQNALGDGRALDANSEASSGGRNFERPAPNYQLNNLLITGNVAGGRGFRGAVGYTAARDFRGDAGSDDLFEFDAASALSSLPVVNLGRSYSPLSLGQDYGLVEFRRATTAATLGALQPRDVQYGEVLDAETRLDQIAISQASQSGSLNPASQGQVLSIYRDPRTGQPITATATDLRGIQRESYGADFSQLGLTAYDRARLLEDIVEGVEIVTPGATFEQFQEKSRRQATERLDPALESTRQYPSVSEDYEEVMRSMIERSAPPSDDESGAPLSPDDAEAETNSELQAIRDYIAGRTDEDPLADPTAEPVVNPADAGRPNLDDPAGFDARARAAEEEEDNPEAPDISVLQHGRLVEALTPANRTRFAEILGQGEERLRRREYFLAERDFVRALRFQPNNPMALAGLSNAQIGAGVQASAALSVRNLFTKHPQMIDVTFGGDILPEQARLDAMLATLNARVDDDRGTPGTGLLIAHIGHQSADVDMIRRGLDLMEQYDSSDPLLDVLRGVWLDE